MPPPLVEQAKVEEAQKLATKLVAHPQHTDAEVCASVVGLNVWTIRLDHAPRNGTKRVDARRTRR